MKLFEPAAIAPKPLRDPRLTAINFVADAVNRTLDLKEIADNALDAVLAVMKMDAGAVYIWQDTDQSLHLFAWRGLSEAFARQVTRLRRGDDATVDAVLDGASKVIEDLELVPQAFRVDVVRAGFRSAVLMPIRAHGFVVGLLALGTYRLREFTEQDVDLIEVISNQIGNAMVHAQLQADVRASEEQYRSLVENSDDAIFIAGPDCRPRFANSAFQSIFGFSPQELAALDPYQRIHPDDVGTVRRTIAKLLHCEPVRNLEYRFCRKDGAWIDLQCSASAFSREGDRVKELQFIVRDVTQVRRRQQQLLRRNRQLAALTMLAEVANSSLKIDEIARNTLEVALESAGMDAGCIHLADPSGRKLNLCVQIGLPRALVDQVCSLGWGEGVSGTVAACGQAKIFTDLGPDASKPQPAAAHFGFKALIVVPVKAKGELMGTLGLASKHEMQFAPEVVEMITAMGNQLGIAVANARLYEAQLRENEKLNALVDISSGSAQRLELEPLLQRILHNAATLLDADAAYIARYDGRANEAQVVAASEAFADSIGRRFAAGEGLLRPVCGQRQGRIFSQDELARDAQTNPMLQNANLRSALVVPLVSRNELIGALTLTRQRPGASDFTAADLELIEAFASRAAVAIDNAQLLKDLERKNELLQLMIEEAHHRIKNNLQMISGLLQIDADAARAGSDSFLRAAIARIQAIAQVHNLLSEEMPEKVDAEMLITTIVNTLVSSAPVANGPPQVSLELEHLWLSADQAVPLSLIVNELLANALMHGRPPEGQKLCIRIRCARQGDSVRLSICDNGGGFVGTTDWRQLPGQGMNIVCQLAQINLRGDLRIEVKDGGVCAELQFAITARGVGPAATSIAR